MLGILNGSKINISKRRWTKRQILLLLLLCILFLFRCRFIRFNWLLCCCLLVCKNYVYASCIIWSPLYLLPLQSYYRKSHVYVFVYVLFANMLKCIHSTEHIRLSFKCLAKKTIKQAKASYNNNKSQNHEEMIILIFNFLFFFRWTQHIGIIVLFTFLRLYDCLIYCVILSSFYLSSKWVFEVTINNRVIHEITMCYGLVPNELQTQNNLLAAAAFIRSFISKQFL